MLLFDVSLMAGSTTKRQHTQHLLTTPRLPSTTPPEFYTTTYAAPPRKRSTTPPNLRCPSLLHCSDLHNQIWSGQELLHDDCSFVLRWNGILHWCSSVLHQILRYTELLKIVIIVIACFKSSFSFQINPSELLRVMTLTRKPIMTNRSLAKLASHYFSQAR